MQMENLTEQKHLVCLELILKLNQDLEVVLPETDAKKDEAITTVIQFTTVLAQVVSALATISLLKK
jgi:molybdopterin/thiamine biosynthesis adenylyltransferase